MLLVLVLTMAMMVPAFAAGVEPRASSHPTTTQTSLTAVFRDYTYVNEMAHYKNFYYDHRCTTCAAIVYVFAYHNSESHYSNNCPCGFSYRSVR